MKVFGQTERYTLVNTQGNRTIVSYGIEAVDQENSTWHEVSFPKAHSEKPSLEQVKEAIAADINAQTDERILSGFTWNGHKVWLSSENQFNYKAAFDLAMMTEGKSLPVTFKFGTDEEPVYHTFESSAELQDFYVAAMGHVNTCLSEGWTKKDTMDWKPYEEALGQTA